MGLTKAERHNRMLDRVFADYHKRLVAMDIRQLIANKQLDDFSEFVDANQHLSVREAIDTFKALQNIPF